MKTIYTLKRNEIFARTDYDVVDGKSKGIDRIPKGTQFTKVGFWSYGDDWIVVKNLSNNIDYIIRQDDFKHYLKKDVE